MSQKLAARSGLAFLLRRIFKMSFHVLCSSFATCISALRDAQDISAKKKGLLKYMFFTFIGGRSSEINKASYQFCLKKK